MFGHAADDRDNQDHDADQADAFEEAQAIAAGFVNDLCQAFDHSDAAALHTAAEAFILYLIRGGAAPIGYTSKAALGLAQSARAFARMVMHEEYNRAGAEEAREEALSN